MACQFEYNGEWYSEEELKAVFNNPQKPSTVINASLKATNVLFSSKADDFFKVVERNKLSGDVFWKKMQSDLSIPKEQIDILKSFGTQKRDELITNLLANYSYTVEINTAKNTRIQEWQREIDRGNLDPDALDYAQKGRDDVEKNAQYYSNLTVPGGTNYTENEIATPAITPSIKGHAQFSTDNGIGWFRADERQVNLGGAELSKEYVPDIEQLANGKWEVSYMPITGGRKLEFFKTDKEAKDFVKIITKTSDEKTRRILEVQSDLFQKGRNIDNLAGKVIGNAKYRVGSNPYGRGAGELSSENLPYAIVDNESGEVYDFYKTEQEANSAFNTLIQGDNNSKENQFLQLLNKDNNWVTFFIKSIIQDSAKQTVTEVQESDVETKVRELEKSGLLKINCP